MNHLHRGALAAAALLAASAAVGPAVAQDFNAAPNYGNAFGTNKVVLRRRNLSFLSERVHEI